jgi:RimJ/RimL family protein N-acetyltransferase
MEGTVSLRRFEPDDVAAVHSWFNDAATTAALLEQRASFAVEDARDWVERAIADGGEDRKWALDVPGIDTAAGFTALYGLDRQIAPEVGILLAPPARGRGLAAQALRLTVEQAFEALGAHRVYARILSSNDASRHVFASLGFRQEGTLRAHVRRGETLIDVELWGLLRDELAPAER